MHRALHTSITLLALAPAAGVQLAGQSRDTTCVPQSELTLGRVRLAASLTDVQEALGRPLRQHRSSSEDDGGQYEVLQLTFRRFEVDIGRGQRVERLATTSPAVALPSGVRVGLTLGAVAEKLHLSNAAQRLRGDTLSPTVCWGDDFNPDLAIIKLVFAAPSSAERRLARIELTNYGP